MIQTCLPEQHLIAAAEPPSIETRTQWCRKASHEELLCLRWMVLDRLCADGGESQRWSPYVIIAGHYLRDRGMQTD